jgi:4'-phosphopantetheinyl transferase EntD
VQAELAGLFSPGVAVCCGPIVAGSSALRSLEVRHAESMGPERRAEYETGRALARRALAALGVPDADLPPDRDRVPAWPAGYCGSISHARCTGVSLCAAAAAPRDLCVSLGLDVECVRRFEPRLVRRIVTPAEEHRLTDQGLDALDCAVTVFSAKEALYKALFPLTRQVLDFPDVRIDLTPAEGTFTAVLAPHADARSVGDGYRGRFCRTPAFVAAAVEIPASPRSPDAAGGV